MNNEKIPETMKEVQEKLMAEYPEGYSNPNLVPRISKVVVHCNVGEAGDALETAEQILRDITNRKPALIRAKRTEKEFGIREGQPIGWKITLRGEKAFNFIKRVLQVYENSVWKGSIDKRGNLSFGIEEHQEIPGAEYDPELGIIGFDVSVSLSRSGYRVKRRKEEQRSIPEKHQVGKEDAIRFFETIGNVREGKREKREAF